MNDPFRLQALTGTRIQRAELCAIAQVRVLVRFTEIRALHTHNLSLVGLSAAWTGQQRFQGRQLAGGKSMAHRSIESSDRAEGLVRAGSEPVAALRTPPHPSLALGAGALWVALQA